MKQKWAVVPLIPNVRGYVIRFVSQPLYAPRHSHIFQQIRPYKLNKCSGVFQNSVNTLLNFLLFTEHQEVHNLLNKSLVIFPILSQMDQIHILTPHFFKIYTVFLQLPLYSAVAQWLRRCATNWKVAGSIPASVNGIFIDVKSFLSHYGPGVDSASNRNEYQEHFLGVKAAGA